MRRFPFIPSVLITLLLLPLPASASRVLKASKSGMMISQAKDDKWQDGDQACVVRNAKKIACGVVRKTNNKSALVRFTKTTKIRPRKGDRVVLIAPGGRAQPNQRKPAATQTYSFSRAKDSREGREDKFNLTGGFNASFSLFYPTLMIQFGLSENIAIGLRPHFFRLSTGATSLTSFGGHLTLSYYGKRNYKGLWVQLGGGLYSLSVKNSSTSESFTSLGALGTLGWRLRFKSGFNVGIAAGAMFISPQDSNLVAIEFAEFKPMLALDAGFTF